MSDTATALASAFFATKLACLHAQPADDATTLIAGDIRVRGAPGSRVWFETSYLGTAATQAEKTLAAVLSRHQESRRRPRGGGLIVAADVAAVVEMVRGIASGLGFTAIGDDLVDEAHAAMVRRVEATLARMKRDGALKQLNRAYKAERATGAPLPGFSVWLASRVAPMFNGLRVG